MLLHFSAPKGGLDMPVIKDPENWTVSDCIEDCHYASRYCREQKDGSLQCPSGMHRCAEDCRRQFSS